MCDHNFIKLGNLMIYSKPEFSPTFFEREEEKDKKLRGVYSRWTRAAERIFVYQCSLCGKIKFSTGVLEKVCSKE